ncbi:hypothetical protein RhiirA5_353097 [Rhizophagus irregularis]|uniref:Uncharacterized protein n=2 Tax=Rhizophagus irregularis TaxID=588596 RepID=A0A2N0PZT3_9GLOM|nr:hypothetical protein RhiirA5_353097 [Rhizophagus irregularis]GBC24431.1 hypothetical protein RIR_e16289_A0A2N0PZT3_9GLOM [Rhizophagus irregularis DAOM 181602=DAOM 197198]
MSGICGNNDYLIETRSFFLRISDKLTIYASKIFIIRPFFEFTLHPKLLTQGLRV